MESEPGCLISMVRSAMTGTDTMMFGSDDPHAESLVHKPLAA